jgi:cell division protein FtsI (penicillin-binding protein 3)
MLEMAVQPGGTAPKAQVSGYRVAGKTGTARKLDSGVYTTRYVSSFVGLAPVSDPRLIVAVMIDEPSAGKYYGGEVSAPVFSQVMGGALRVLGVAPDAPLKPVNVANAAPAVPESM